MRKIISILMVLMLLMGTLPVFASGRTPTVSIYGEYTSGNCVITGTSYMGEGSAVTLRVQGPDGENSKTVYHKQLTCEKNGLFTWSFPMPEGIEAGTYKVLASDRNGTGSANFSYPFNSTETKLVIEGIDDIIFMKSDTEPDDVRNTFLVYVKNGSVRDKVKLTEGTDFVVTGLPEGFGCTAEGDSDKEAIVFTVDGTAEAAVTDICDISVSLNCSAVIPDDGVNSSSEETKCATLYNFEKSSTPVISLTSDNSLSMRSAQQMSDSTFALESKYHAFRQGALTPETDFSFTAPEGFGLSAVSNGKEIEFAVSYNGSGVASSTSISVVVKPSAFEEGVGYDSNSVSVPVSRASSGGGLSGGNGGGGGGGGGGGAGSNNKEDDETKPEEPKQDEKPRKTFADTQEHWAKDYIELLAGAEVVNGVSDGVFAPDNKITRAEFAAMLVRAAGLEDAKATSQFSDVDESDWFYSYVYAGQGAGIIDGYDGKFNPNALVTREEMTKMVVCTFEGLVDIPIDTYAYATFFSDFDTIGDWAKDYVHMAAFFGLVNGTSVTVFSPKANTTRAEAATVIYRMLNKCDNINQILTQEASSGNIIDK